MVWGFDDLRKGAVLHIFDTEVLVLAVCNEGLLGHYPGGLFNNDTVLAVDDYNNKDKGKNHEVRILVIPKKGEESSLPFSVHSPGKQRKGSQVDDPGRHRQVESATLSPKLFFGVFCRILDFLTSLFDLLPGFFHRLIDLLAGALRRAFFFLAAG
jgi:hypothetical protein